MRAALIVNRTTASREHNLQGVLAGIGRAAESGAELVMFPEAALTGLVNNDRPARDLGFGIAVPGPEARAMAAMAQTNKIALAIGVLERAGSRLFDTALLFAPGSPEPFVYRRISPGWHGRKAPLRVYGAGTEVNRFEHRLGKFAFLVCGDLFDDKLVAKVRELRPDWLLVPMHRCFGDGSHDQRHWEEKELPAYVERVRLVGTTTLITNCLAERSLGGGSFGGAWAIGLDGEVLAGLPLGSAGMLFVDL
jgi:N-carbamoylputrescine amidase